MAARVALIKNHLALCEGLKLLLVHELGCEVVGSTDSAEEIVSVVREKHPEVAVVDIGVSTPDAVELTKKLVDADPQVGVLLYSGLDDIHTLQVSFEAGARGFALKQGTASELKEAIEVVAAGGTYVDPRVRPKVTSHRDQEQDTTLSPREREILGLLANGLTGEEVAKKLFLSPETVRTHVRNAMEKLEASTRTHAVIIALRRGEITL